MFSSWRIYKANISVKPSSLVKVDHMLSSAPADSFQANHHAIEGKVQLGWVTDLSVSNSTSRAISPSRSLGKKLQAFLHQNKNNLVNTKQRYRMWWRFPTTMKVIWVLIPKLVHASKRDEREREQVGKLK